MHVLIVKEGGAVWHCFCECNLYFGVLSKEDIRDPCSEHLAGLIHAHRQHAKIQNLLILDRELLAAQKDKLG